MSILHSNNIDAEKDRKTVPKYKASPAESNKMAF